MHSLLCTLALITLYAVSAPFVISIDKVLKRMAVSTLMIIVHIREMSNGGIDLDVIANRLF